MAKQCTQQRQKQSDEQLVRAFQAGDSGAFAIFAQRHADGAYRLACLWLVDTSQAPDACQEALLRSYTGFARFRFRAQAKTWLMRVLRNVCREMNRGSVRQQTKAPNDIQQTVESTEAGRAVGPLGSAGLDSAQPGQGAQAKLLAALHALPQRQREVVSLRLVQDFTVAEAAQVLGCRPGTVKAHLHKALANLRRSLKVENLVMGQWLEQNDS